jgi:hypothetical protein
MKMKMFTIIISFLMCASLPLVSNAQTLSDSITIKGHLFYQGGKKLKMNQLVNTLQSNEEAFQQIKIAQSSYNTAAVFSFAGGFLIGWTIGSVLGGSGEEPNLVLAGIGGGLMAISLPFQHKFKNEAKQAINIYNNGLQTTSFKDKRELKFLLTGNGVGLAFHF